MKTLWMFGFGILLGILLSTLGVQGGDTDSLGRTPFQQRLDYYRQYGQQLDIEHLRRQQDTERLRREGRLPC